MKIQKAVMTTDGPNLKFAVPFSKVDAKKRLVSGFATLDNSDEHGDVVTAEASNKAFSRFRGNLREMHAPIAVGKVLDFENQTYYDERTEQFYEGVWVTAYVSTGAEDTWQKVLDGTLTGFSIGGRALETEDGVSKSNGEQVRFIKDYELLELSLVDNPANQLANIFSIVKSQDGMMVKGLAVDVKTENVLYCATDEFIIPTKKDAASCAECGNAMQNIGWVESDSSNKVDVVKSLVAKAKADSAPHKEHVHFSIDTGNMNAEDIAEAVFKKMRGEVLGEGGKINVTTTNEEVTETAVVDETAAVNDEVVVEPTAEVPVEAEPVAEEEVVEQPDFAKMLAEVQEAIVKTITTSQDETKAAIEAVKTDVDSVVKGLETKFSELETKFGSLQAENAEVAKRVDSVVDETAIRKSAELGGTQPVVKKSSDSPFKGVFLSIE